LDPDKMVHNANQISLFFASYPREEAISGIANHLRQFWVPRMRRQIIDYVEKEGGEGLHEFAIEAVKRLPAPVVR
jgi:formate dehydrogenase subunit delta